MINIMMRVELAFIQNDHRFPLDIWNQQFRRRSQLSVDPIDSTVPPISTPLRNITFLQGVAVLLDIGAEPRILLQVSQISVRLERIHNAFPPPTNSSTLEVCSHDHWQLALGFNRQLLIISEEDLVCSSRYADPNFTVSLFDLDEIPLKPTENSKLISRVEQPWLAPVDRPFNFFDTRIPQRARIRHCPYDGRKVSHRLRTPGNSRNISRSATNYGNCGIGNNFRSKSIDTLHVNIVRQMKFACNQSSKRATVLIL